MQNNIPSQCEKATHKVSFCQAIISTLMVNLPDNLFNQFAYRNYVSWPKQSFQQSLISLLLNGPTILGKKIGLTLLFNVQIQLLLSSHAQSCLISQQNVTRLSQTLHFSQMDIMVCSKQRWYLYLPIRVKHLRTQTVDKFCFSRK